MKQKLIFSNVKALIDYIMEVRGASRIEDLGAMSIVGKFATKEVRLAIEKYNAKVESA